MVLHRWRGGNGFIVGNASAHFLFTDTVRIDKIVKRKFITVTARAGRNALEAQCTKVYDGTGIRRYCRWQLKF